ncbi:MAG: hypothetical protein EOO65_05320 [Methanosarcinales archaeon]|nr:MAG: hypothetical protein EOO65_05320 [Methanosarcinales archaeon]
MPTYSGYGTGVPDVLRSSLASLPPPTRAAGGREDDGKEASSRAGTPFRSQPVVMPVGMQALSVPALQHEVMAQPAFLTAAKGRNKFNPPPATAGSVRAAMFERGALAVTNMNERVALPPSPTSRWRPDRTSYELSTDHGSESAEWAREWTAESRVASSPAEDGVGKPGVTMPSALRLEDSLQMPSESSTRALAEWRGWAADGAAGSAPATNARTMRTAPAPVHGEARPVQTTSMTPQYAHLAASASTVQGSETLLRGQKQPLTGGGMLGGGLHVQSARMHLTARMAATGDASSSGSGGVSACAVAEPPCTE